MRLVHAPSPNFNERRHALDMLVLHYTGMETGEDALERMRDPASAVSAHYMVWEDGAIVQLVGEEKRAWHAGVASWQGDEDLNSRSIGVEIVNGGHDWPEADGSLPPYRDVQIAGVISLCRAILARHAIPPSRIVGHSDIAPARKADPGEHFPWERLARAGIGIWPPEDESVRANVWGTGLGARDTGPPVLRLKESLREIGYSPGATADFDAELGAVITAFQRRWRPDAVSGLADPVTIARVEQVRQAMPSAAT